MFWDYLSQNPESVHQVMILMGDRGIPDGWRKMHGYAGHTMKLINKNGDWVYAQMHMKSKQGTGFITQEDSANYSPDYAQKDLFNAIEKGDFPGWDVMWQTMTPKEAEDVFEKQGINIFDLTHVWPQKQFPLRKVGEFFLNEVSGFIRRKPRMLTNVFNRTSRTTLPKSSKSPSTLHTCRQALSHLPTRSCSPDSSPTQIHIAIVSVSTTSNCRSTPQGHLTESPTFSVMVTWPSTIRVHGQRI